MIVIDSTSPIARGYGMYCLMEARKIKRYLLDRGIVHIYTIFIAGYFLMPMAAGHRRLFYFLVLPAVALLWQELRAFYRGNALFQLLGCYTLYMLLSLSWSDTRDITVIYEALWQSLMVIPFCLISGYLWIQYPQRMDQLAHRVVWLAAAAAVCSVLAWYLVNPFPESRLEPLGVMWHPNKSACVYGVALLFCAYYVLTERGQENRGLYLALAAILLSLILLTQSRTALAAVCIGVLVLAGWRALGAIAVAVAASWILVASNPQDWWHRVAEFSFRPGIWRQQIADMSGNWLFGHGLRSETTVAAYDKVFTHAHNSYIASLRDGGIVGLLLMAALLALALLWSIKIWQQRGERIYLALILYAMTCITMDFDRILVAPRELWLFFWLPIALIMATYPHRHDLALTRYRNRSV
jgi:hypothetical protein